MKAQSSLSSLAVCLLVVVLLSPIILVSYLLCLVVLLPATLRSNISTTAYSPLGTRWLLHVSGRRPDAAAARVFFALPGVVPATMYGIYYPLHWAEKLSGYELGYLKYPPPSPTSLMTMLGQRTWFFDRAIEESLSTVKQVVLLGAGWDTRAYGLLAEASVTVFEVDQPETQQLKRVTLEAVGVDSTSVHFAACDFNQESWLSSLRPTGFDESLPTFVLWEGVHYYLEPQASARLLGEFASALPPGSQIAFDYVDTSFSDGSGSLAQRFLGRMLRVMGEPWLSGISTESPTVEQARTYLARQGLSLEAHDIIGSETPHKRPMGGMIRASIPETS